MMDISGDRGAKALLKGRRVGWVDWPDERLALDIDSREDYQIAISLKEIQPSASSGLTSR
jgi:CTP:molybdopterin cytidylyltransferase MocA